MGVRVLYLLAVLFLLACAPATRTPIHKVVGKETLRVKVVLLESKGVDPAYQKMAVREFEASLLKQPLTRAIRESITRERVDVVLITRKEVQKVKNGSPAELVRIGRESDLDLVVVVEPISVDYREKTYTKEDRICVRRSARVSVSAKVAETGKGSVVLAGVYTGRSRAVQCSKGIRRTDKLPSRDGMVIKALKEAASKFSKEFWGSL
ncbi:MAG: hypothetical protein Q9N26_01120 [Aquificota bacterium]|nr:hypothetical protein [Aquificota bacterium]